MEEKNEKWLEDGDKTTLEADQSVTIRGYYKGFSVLVTKRSASAKVLPLIEDAIKEIDYMLEKGFKPSWVDDTNNKQQTEALGQCPKCGSVMALSKAGKPYCKALCWKNG